ncbi:hypothetical protein PCE1_002865 [Barthelona sp. PCE]
MPRLIKHHGDDISYSLFGDWLVMFSTDDSLNQNLFQIVTKCDDGIVAGPDSSLPNDIDCETSNLQASIQEPSVFYRYEKFDDVVFGVEVFEFNDGEFSCINQFLFEDDELMDGHLLNRRYWIFGSGAGFVSLFDMELRQVYELQLYDRLVHYGRYQVYSLLVQDNLTYLIHSNAKQIHHILSFDDDCIPFLEDDHPLMGQSFHSLDKTPGDNRVIFRSGDKFFYQSSELVRREIEFYKKCYKSVVRVEGVHVCEMASMPVFNNGICCKQWNFVQLNNKIYSMDHINGMTLFYPLMRHNIRGMFSIENTTCTSRRYLNFLQQKLNFIKFEANSALWDFYTGTVTFFIPTNKYKGCVLKRVDHFYDCSIGRWLNCYVVESPVSKFLYWGDSQFRCFPKGGFQKCNCKFMVDVKPNIDEEGEAKYRLFVNDAYIVSMDMSILQAIQLNGNFVFFFNNNNFSVVILDDEGIVKIFESFNVNGRIFRIMCNPYCQEEIMISLGQNRVYMRFDYGLKSFIELIEFRKEGQHVPMFVGRGAIVINGSLHFFDCNNDQFAVEIPKTYHNCTHVGKNTKFTVVSPQPGVLVTCHREMTDFNVKMNILMFNSNYRTFTDVERTIDIRRFLLNCKVSVFNSFEKYK